MPHMIVRGISVLDIQSISSALIAELAEVCDCGTDNFMLECLSTVSIFEGEICATYPFIEVGWFERGPEVRDAYAGVLTKHILSLGIPEVEIAFKVYKEDSYYWNGKLV
ncbi:hypothetical protein A8709_26285 [Paenibacillus pectinilyticus]|uniref:DUF1904 domain-containing protein n=1 Tax=Paenibacillus pectinilyticus TaxID=512399 RepID=A0A1C1A1C9_9BACL|nr:DUF1904 family protein [Paenibacillus pectinilyticus]OCT14336.1 hypothetical protein A8709_26285 [Paenibacillus pectinilyticus]